MENKKKIAQSKYDKRMWILHKQPFEVKIRQLGEEMETCDHLQCKQMPKNYCVEKFVCTCPQYIRSEVGCDHIDSIEKLDNLNCKLFKGRMTDMHLETLMEDGAKKDCTDEFDYKTYFSNEKNFCLDETKIKKDLYWKGYEDVLARHHFGLELVLSKMYAPIVNEQSMRIIFWEKEVLTNVAYVTQLNYEEVECECSAFELCSTCRMCRHQIFCSCKDYCCGYFCKHCHAFIMAWNTKKIRPYQYRKLHEYYRNEFRRFFYLCLWIRVRHNVGIRLRTLRYPKSSVVLVEVRENGSDDVYEVQIGKKTEPCSCNVLMECQICECCVHDYTCSCTDFVNNYLCIHIHAAAASMLKKNVNRFSEENRDIDRISFMDPKEADDLESRHPCITWNEEKILEYKYLAYKYSFFKVVELEHIDRKIVRIRGQKEKTYMLPLHWGTTEKDQVLNLNKECEAIQLLGKYIFDYTPYCSEQWPASRTRWLWNTSLPNLSVPESWMAEMGSDSVFESSKSSKDSLESVEVVIDEVGSHLPRSFCLTKDIINMKETMV